MNIKEQQRQHYDRMFREYEEKTEKSAYMNLLRSKYTFDRWVDRLAGKRILDLGCGHGNTSRRLAAEHCSVIGLDLSMQFVCRTRERVGNYDMAGWIQGDAESLPLLDGALDAVVSFGTLHHLPHPQQAIAEISRVLRPGGWLLALEPNATPYRTSLDFYSAVIPSSLQSKLRRWRAQRPIYTSEVEEDEFHVGTRTPGQYRDFFESANMQGRITTMILPIFPFTLAGLHRLILTWQVTVWISAILDSLIPSLREKGKALIIEAQKINPDA